MKKFILFSVPLALFLCSLPAVSQGGYAIHLKNGGHFITPHYWQEGREILFHVSTGVIGVEIHTIARIEETDEPVHSAADGEPEPGPELIGSDEEEVDIEAYRDMKDQLVQEVEDIIGRMHEATGRGDREAEARLREEMRRTSARIYELTDEVTEKNQGRLPEGWWDRR